MDATPLRARRLIPVMPAGDCAVPSVSVPSPEIDKSISTSPRGRGDAPSARTLTLPSPSGRGAGGEGVRSGYSEACIAYAGQIIPDTSGRKPGSSDWSPQLDDKSPGVVVTSELLGFDWIAGIHRCALMPAPAGLFLMACRPPGPAAVTAAAVGTDRWPARSG